MSGRREEEVSIVLLERDDLALELQVDFALILGGNSRHEDEDRVVHEVVLLEKVAVLLALLDHSSELRPVLRSNPEVEYLLEVFILHH